jgi:hypothetical protein
VVGANGLAGGDVAGVRRLTGRDPRTVDAFLNENAAAFGATL